jgi:hypothetical protein
MQQFEEDVIRIIVAGWQRSSFSLEGLVRQIDRRLINNWVAKM